MLCKEGKKPKQKWIDGIEDDIKIAGVSVQDVGDCAICKCRT